MSLLTHAWMGAGRARRRVKWRLSPNPPREELVRRYAPGRSFIDVGCIGKIHGEIAFIAEESGATRVTALDIHPATPELEAERERRASKVEYMQGDIHLSETVEAAGVFDLVWCAGLFYHTPSPITLLKRLRDMTGELLIVGTQAIPEVPGVPHACVYVPMLDEREREPYNRTWQPGLGISTPYDLDSVYGNTFFAVSPSALRAMLGSVGMEVIEAVEEPFRSYVVARPTGNGRVAKSG